MPCARTVLRLTTFENPTKPGESLYMKFVQIMQYKIYYKRQTFFLCVQVQYWIYVSLLGGCLLFVAPFIFKMVH